MLLTINITCGYYDVTMIVTHDHIVRYYHHVLCGCGTNLSVILLDHCVTVCVLATMVWMVGMADTENGAAGGGTSQKKKKKKKVQEETGKII